MTVTGRLELVAFDAADIRRTADFYVALTGWKKVKDEEDWITLRGGDGQEVAFQLAPDHRPPEWPGQELPQHVHLDLFAEDYQAAARRAEELGATRLADGAHWVTLADPAGHPFDLCQKDGVTGPELPLFATTLDTTDAVGLARFYGALTGMELAYDGPEGALISDGTRNVMFQQVAEYTPPRWPDPAAPQQAHLDIQVDDLDAGEARALELGATRFDAGTDTFRVFADPAGHPFCLTS